MQPNKYLLPGWRTPELKATRSGVGEGLVELGLEHKDVIVLTADLASSVKVREFAEKYPEQFFDVGVAEQNMAGVAAGLSFEKLIPFIASYATFSPGRNWEQVRVSICLSRANVKIIGSHAGVSSGVNGPSHQGTEDIAIMRALPNMVVIVPADANQASAATKAAYNIEGPVYMRATRPDTPNYTKISEFEIGKAYVYREGRDITICACGIQVWQALMVAEELFNEGIDCEVINVSSIKPLDEATILKSVKKTGKIITLEDHQVAGGMGSAVAEFLSQKYPVLLKRVGINDQFGVSGEWEDVYNLVGLDSASIKKAVVDWFHE